MGLLDKFNRGMQAVQTGLLGNATAYNPQISQYLSPGVLEKANADARMQLGLAMLAASESGMGFGQGLMMAQQAAGQAFQQPMAQDLQATMTADAMRRVQDQRQQEAKFGEFLKSLPAEQQAQLSALPKNVAYQVMAELMTQQVAPGENWQVLPDELVRQYGLDPSSDWQVNTRTGKIDKLYSPPAAPSVSVTLPADNAFLKSLGENAAKQLDSLQTSADSASKLLASTQRIKPLVDDPGFISGPAGEARLAIAKVLGLPGAEATQTYFAAVGEQVAERIKAFGAGTGLSDADREFAKQIAAGSIELTPGAIKRIIDINEKSAQALIGLYNERRDFYGAKQPEVFNYYPTISSGWSIKKK